MRNLINLHTLYLNYNQISIIPPELGNLINLQRLDLYKNQISIIPPELGNLINLQTLWLNKNQINTTYIKTLPSILASKIFI